MNTDQIAADASIEKLAEETWESVYAAADIIEWNGSVEECVLVIKSAIEKAYDQGRDDARWINAQLAESRAAHASEQPPNPKCVQYGCQLAHASEQGYTTIAPKPKYDPMIDDTCPTPATAESFENDATIAHQRATTPATDAIEQQKAVAMTRTCLWRLREERRSIEDAKGKDAVPAYLKRCIDYMSIFETPTPATASEKGCTCDTTGEICRPSHDCPVHGIGEPDSASTPTVVASKAGKDGLLPCPFCGQRAAFADDGEGGEFVMCQNPICEASSKLIVPEKTDGKLLLAEAWNNRAATPSGGDPCVICEQPITEYDSYGVSAKSNHRYHWHCVRKEAATVSASGGGEWTVSRELYTATLRDSNFTELLRLSLTQDVDLQRIADAHNAALRDLEQSNTDLQDALEKADRQLSYGTHLPSKAAIAEDATLRDCGNDTKRLDWVLATGGWMDWGFDWNRAAIDAAMLETGEQTDLGGTEGTSEATSESAIHAACFPATTENKTKQVQVLPSHTGEQTKEKE